MLRLTIFLYSIFLPCYFFCVPIFRLWIYLLCCTILTLYVLEKKVLFTSLEPARQPYSTMASKIIITLLLIIPASISKSAKTNARPVHEVINEQARIDEKVKLASPGSLPYGNPLAGNSQQNARLHAQNQQAMFNAERVRQHRAQLQRWTKAPIRMDSYMKAYHESQESHQLALEQQQAKLRDAKVVATTPKTRRPEKRGETKRVERIRLQSPEPTKITKADAVIKERSRNHRSHGSLDYYQYLQPKRYQTVYVSPAPTYDQGVTIKPNGNVGLKHYKTTQESKLFTEAVPSTTKYVYPKQFHQMQEYQSAQDIDALKSLLKNNPKDQLSGLNALIISGNQNKEEEEKKMQNLETPIDLYFYLKDTPKPSLPQQYDYSKYAQMPHYASAYMPEPVVKDHTPITEEVDDVEDPNKHHKVRPFGVQPIVTQAPVTQENTDTTTTKSNNYYKVEVASQTITSGHNTQYREPDYYINEDTAKPSYQALQYAQPQYTPSSYERDESDQSERYLHHNAQHTGVQHLTGDGTGVSAYGDDNLHYAANYEFGYRVRDNKSGNDFGHQEAKQGEKTNGAYHVLLPDGRMQKVRYSAGPEGFHADISYDHLQYKH